MMFLYNAIRAEVEPVPGQPGWYQLTGKHITRWTCPSEETAYELKQSGIELDVSSKILGIHTADEEIELKDPRFNGQSNTDEPMFYVYIDRADGRTYMMLTVNQPEYALFRFLVPHESATADDDGDEYDPMSEYRVEPTAG